MPGRPPKVADLDFARLFEELGARKLAEKLGQRERQIYQRRERVEKNLRRQLVTPEQINTRSTRVGVQHAARIHAKVYDGVVLVGSDAHIWPGPKTTAMRAFIKFCKTLRPKVAILNGDVLDLARISRHPPIGWENRPTVAEEIDSGKKILHEIELAVPRECALIWTLGNHDARFETRLATVAPEYAKLNGVHLKDNFPQWSACWSCWINDDVVIKHRFKGGMGATRANTLNSGKSMVTGHLHSSKVTPLTDYNATRYGVDTGCLANPSHPAFTDYTEDGPLDWRSGFGVLTFREGKLLMPELVQVWDDDTVQFRGELIKV
jgi:hypothetical protein